MNGAAIPVASERGIAADPTAGHFSPILLIGLALRPLPLAPLQAMLALVTRAMTRRHPQVFARLQSLGGAVIAIDASDLPCLFEFRPNAPGDKLRLVPGHCDPTVDRFDWYVGVRNGRVECLWPIAARGGFY